MPTLYLFSKNFSSIEIFLLTFFKNNVPNTITIFNNYKLSFSNPLDMCNIVSAIIDNNDIYNISIWINLDDDLYFKVTQNNLNDFIKYLYERLPY